MSRSFLPSFFRKLSSGRRQDSSPDLEASRSDSPREIRQYASKVVNFSSQYGTAGTNSYTASNLAGERQIGEKYGDFVEAFVLVIIDTNSLSMGKYRVMIETGGVAPINYPNHYCRAWGAFYVWLTSSIRVVLQLE